MERVRSLIERRKRATSIDFSDREACHRISDSASYKRSQGLVAQLSETLDKRGVARNGWAARPEGVTREHRFAGLEESAFWLTGATRALRGSRSLTSWWKDSPSNPGLEDSKIGDSRREIISCLRDMASYKGRMVDALAMRGDEGRGQLR